MSSETIAICQGVTANRIRRSVTRDGLEVFLSPQQFEIFLIISRAKFGVTPTRLFAAIYAGSIDGGPLSGRKAIHVQRRNLNQKIAPLGLHIKSAGSGFRDRAYELSAIEVRVIDASRQHSPLSLQFVSHNGNARRTARDRLRRAK